MIPLEAIKPKKGAGKVTPQGYPTAKKQNVVKLPPHKVGQVK